VLRPIERARVIELKVPASQSGLYRAKDESDERKVA
jgi:hypothetical protein